MGIDPTEGGTKPDVVHGVIVNDGEDGSPIVIDNPVPVPHAMSVGERTRRAMALKLSGASYAAIAAHLGYNDASAARKAVVRGMKGAQQENAGELRRIHYARLEHILTLLWPDVQGRDLASIQAALSVMDRMERLHGLNAAERLEVSAGRETVIVADGDTASYIAALEEAGRRIAPGLGQGSGQAEDEDDEGDEA